jgi:hypothetical protein
LDTMCSPATLSLARFSKTHSVPLNKGPWSILNPFRQRARDQYYRVEIQISNKRTKIKEIRNNILIIVNLKVIDLIKAFKLISNINGDFKMLESSSNMRTTNARIATELG